MSEFPKDSSVELLKMMADGYQKILEKQKAIEAKKSPEQRAKEAEVSRLHAERIQKEKAEKEKNKRIDLFSHWLKRDTWLIYDEAMPLIKAEIPDTETLINLRDAKLWGVVKSCAGYSLAVVNQQEALNKWRVKPYEWVRWLKEKGYIVPEELLDLLTPKVNKDLNSSTARATQSREKSKAHRISALKQFLHQIEAQARKLNIEWDPQAMPATKGELLNAFQKANKDIKQITPSTFENDLTQIGAKCKRGIKSNKNNILKQILTPI